MTVTSSYLVELIKKDDLLAASLLVASTMLPHHKHIYIVMNFTSGFRVKAKQYTSTAAKMMETASRWNVDLQPSAPNPGNSGSLSATTPAMIKITTARIKQFSWTDSRK